MMSSATVLFNVCSAVTVVLCFVPALRGCVWKGLLLCKKNALLQCLYNCACDPSVYLNAPFNGFVCVCRKLSPHLSA